MTIHIDTSGRTKEIVVRLFGHHRVVVLDASKTIHGEVLAAVAGCFRTTTNPLRISGGEVRGISDAQKSDDPVLHVIDPFHAADYAVIDAARRFSIGASSWKDRLLVLLDSDAVRAEPSTLHQIENVAVVLVP